MAGKGGRWGELGESVDRQMGTGTAGNRERNRQWPGKEGDAQCRAINRPV
jgi:hypothetical protein